MACLAASVEMPCVIFVPKAAPAAKRKTAARADKTSAERGGPLLTTLKDVREEVLKAKAARKKKK